jgi:hypothetical protein
MKHSLAQAIAFLLGVLVFASNTAQAQSTLYAPAGSTASAQFGSSVAGAGDVNNDGYVDVIIGSPLDDSAGTDAGLARVISGKTGSVLYSILGTQVGAEFGAAVSGAGDTNNDGWDDFVVGAPGYDNGAYSNGGRVVLYSGKTGAALWSTWTNETGARCGHALADVGDVDHDGFDDIAIGAPFKDHFVPPTPVIDTDAGQVLVISGHTHNTLFTLSSTYAPTFHFDVSFDLLGWAVSGAGDVNNDGWSDLVAGAPQYDPDPSLSNAGAALVYSGFDGSILYVREGTQANAQFGTSVACAGNINNDPYDDVLIGAPLYDGGSTDSGRALVLSGVDGSTLYTINGVGGAHLGAAVAGVGDVNGDNFDDFIIGSPLYDGLFGYTDGGLVQVYSGFNGLQIQAFFGDSASDELGRAVGSTGDINHDGFGDFVIGVPLDDPNGSNSGTARVILTNAPPATTYCTAKTNSQGCVPKIGSVGVPSVSVGDNFSVTASLVLSQKSGLVFWGMAQTSAPFGGGTMCVHEPRVRSAVQDSGGFLGVPCGGTYSFAFTHSYMAIHSISAGTTIYAQWWSRDPGYVVPNNIGLTNALAFHVCP